MHAGIKPQIGADLRGIELTDLPGDFAFRIVEITKYHGATGPSVTGFDTGWCTTLIDPVNAKGTAFHRPLTPRRMGFLIG